MSETAGERRENAEAVTRLADVAEEMAPDELIRAPNGRLVPEVPLDRPLDPWLRPFRRPRNAEPAPRWIGLFLGILALLFVPYIALLAISLPDHEHVEHYAAAWVGLDVMELISLAATAWFAWTRSTWIAMSATAAATLIICDAWFDAITARGAQQVMSVLEAVLVELPMAAFCLWVARHAEVVADRATRLLLRRSARQAERLAALQREPQRASKV